jgi:hypothetical protein
MASSRWQQQWITVSLPLPLESLRAIALGVYTEIAEGVEMTTPGLCAFARKIFLRDLRAFVVKIAFASSVAALPRCAFVVSFLGRPQPTAVMR